MEFQPQVYKGSDGRIYKKQNGRFVELSPEELKDFEFVPLNPEPPRPKVVESDEYVSPQEQENMINKALISAATTLGTTAIGGGLAALLSNPVTGIPTAALGAGVLGSIAASNPEKFKAGVTSMAKGAVEPYVSPVETFKEDPFGAAAAWIPVLSASAGLGKPLSKQLFEYLAKKGITKLGKPASEQLIQNPFTGKVTSMVEPLEYMRSKKVPLTVAQTTESPLAINILSENPKAPEVLAKQNRLIAKDMQDILDTLDKRFTLNSELGEIAAILKDETRLRYTDLLESLRKTKGDLFNAATKSLPSVQIPNPDPSKGNIVIKGAIPLTNASQVAKRINEKELRDLFGSLVASKSTMRMFKNVGEETARINSLVSSLTEFKVTPVENIRIVDLMRTNLDNLLEKLPADNPQRKLLAEFRTALDQDLEEGFKKAGLLQKYRDYKRYASESLSKFKKTAVGEALLPEGTYDVKTSPTSSVRSIFEDSQKFDDLVDIVGTKPAVGGLLNYIFGKSFDASTGGFSADTLIKLISKNKDKLNYLEPGLKTRLFQLAYGIKAQNRLSTANPVFELRGPDAVIKVGGAAATGRKGIIVGQIASATRFLLSKTDLANIMLDPEMGWLAAKLANTQLNSPAASSRIKRFLQGLNRLGIYARIGDTLFSFDVNGAPIEVGSTKED